MSFPSSHAYKFTLMVWNRWKPHTHTQRNVRATMPAMSASHDAGLAKKNFLFLRLRVGKSSRLDPHHPCTPQTSRRRDPRYIHSVLHIGRAKIKSGGRGYKNFGALPLAYRYRNPPVGVSTSSCARLYISVTVRVITWSALFPL